MSIKQLLVSDHSDLETHENISLWSLVQVSMSSTFQLATFIHIGFLLSLFFEPEDGDMFFQNTG
jgi:hypothetical protein